MSIISRKTVVMPAPNERFHASGGVCPQKHLCEFASASPARTFVNPRLREAAGRCATPGKQHRKNGLNDREK
jgi:hypothetical protein